MNQVYEYDCREAAADSLGRIADVVNIVVWTMESAKFESRIERVEKELTTLNVILAQWKRLEAERKAAETKDPVMEETTHPLAKMFAAQQQSTSPVMEETSNQKGDNQ